MVNMDRVATKYVQQKYFKAYDISCHDLFPGSALATPSLLLSYDTNFLLGYESMLVIGMTFWHHRAPSILQRHQLCLAQSNNHESQTLQLSFYISVGVVDRGTVDGSHEFHGQVPTIRSTMCSHSSCRKPSLFDNQTR